jgi:hypothetical protein
MIRCLKHSDTQNYERKKPKRKILENLTMERSHPSALSLGGYENVKTLLERKNFTGIM